MYANLEDKEVDKLTSKFPNYEDSAPVNETLRQQLVQLSRDNFVAYSLAAESKIADSVFDRTIAQNILMPLKYFLENRTFDFGTRRFQMRGYLSGLVDQMVTALDFDPVLNRVVMILRLPDSYLLYMKYLLDDIGGSSSVLCEIQTSEPMLLDVKFFCHLNPSTIVILGMARCYIVELPLIDMNQLRFLDLDSFGKQQPIDFRQKSAREVSRYRDFGAEYNYFGSKLNQARVTRIFPNINFSNFSITKANSYIVFWNRFSKNVQVHDVDTKETFWLYTTHFFDTVEVSNASTEKIVCYSRTDSVGQITIFNLKTQHNFLITVRRNKIQELFEMIGQEVDPSLISSSDYIEVAFWGHQDHVVVLVNGCLLFFANKAYDKSYRESEVSRMHYVLNNVFSLRREIATKVLLIRQTPTRPISASDSQRFRRRPR